MTNFDNMITKNIEQIYGNFFAGIGGLILYPTIHIMTSFPAGPYAIVCYSVHHFHILSCLRNIAILQNRQPPIIGAHKYINYGPFKGVYTSEKRRSMYSLKINTSLSNKYNFWYTRTISQSNLPTDCQKIITDIVNYRDTNTKTSIGMMVASVIGYSIMNLKMTGLISGFGFVMFYNFASRQLNKFDINIVKKSLVINKKYYYINTFGDIVPTNYKYGLYKRYSV